MEVTLLGDDEQKDDSFELDLGPLAADSSAPLDPEAFAAEQQAAVEAVKAVVKPQGETSAAGEASAKQSAKRSPASWWTSEEDAELRSLVEKFGPLRWCVSGVE